jgi:hypothetical protein
LTLSITLTSPG